VKRLLYRKEGEGNSKDEEVKFKERQVGQKSECRAEEHSKRGRVPNMTTVTWWLALLNFDVRVKMCWSERADQTQNDNDSHKVDGLDIGRPQGGIGNALGFHEPPGGTPTR
jgi:ribosomal protein L28